jgi:HEAT repeat protein
VPKIPGVPHLRALRALRKSGFEVAREGARQIVLKRGIADRLKGGDRRSIGNSDEIAAEVANTPAIFPDLFECLFNTDPVIRMRAADAVEKVTRDNPHLLQPWKRPLLETISASEDKEIRWHVAQMLPRLNLSHRERETAVQILMGYLSDESSIVKTLSMQGLADLAAHDEQLRAQITPLIERLTKTDTAAMRSRGRKLLKQLARYSM